MYQRTSVQRTAYQISRLIAVDGPFILFNSFPATCYTHRQSLCKSASIYGVQRLNIQSIRLDLSVSSNWGRYDTRRKNLEYISPLGPPLFCGICTMHPTYTGIFLVIHWHCAITGRFVSVRIGDGCGFAFECVFFIRVFFCFSRTWKGFIGMGYSL